MKFILHFMAAIVWLVSFAFVVGIWFVIVWQVYTTSNELAKVLVQMPSIAVGLLGCIFATWLACRFSDWFRWKFMINTY